MSDIVEILKSLPYFSDLELVFLDEVSAEAQLVDVASGTVVIEEGTLSEEMYIIAEGLLRVVTGRGGREVELARLGPGEVVGEIALLDKAPRNASVVAVDDSVLVEVPASTFEMVLDRPEVLRRMFRTVTSRLRGIETTLRHHERMAALGKMAAQLMHELNNPAAAVGRSSRRLDETSEQLDRAVASLVRRLVDGFVPQAPSADTHMAPLERSDQEESVADLLEAYEVEAAWEMSPALVAEGWTETSIRSYFEGLDPELRADLVRWVGLRSTAKQLTTEIGVGTARISELVRIVKEYSYLDQAPVQEVDIEKGIRDTLMLLKHKLHDVDVMLAIPEGLPAVMAPGRDLNQIWTNLIDNAVDAMDGEGRLEITVTEARPHIVVTVSDSGTGIPDELIDKVFDPFFTTKEPGAGTGLGLATSYAIVNRFGGDIDVDSSPSGTTFRVKIPAQ